MLDSITHSGLCWPSATTQVSVRNTRVFWTALMALMEPRTLCQGIAHFLLARRRVALHTYLLDCPPGIWWHIRTLRMTCALHSSQGLQLCCSCVHTAWRGLCLPLAECNIVSLPYCYISDASWSPYMMRFEIWSLITIHSSLRIHRLLLHLLPHHHILPVEYILSNLHTL